MSEYTTMPAPPSEDVAEEWLEFQIKRQERIEGCYEAAHKAIKLAKKFAAESLTSGFDHRDDRRVLGCIQQIRAYRQQIARLRAMKWCDVDTVLVVALPDLSEVA